MINLKEVRKNKRLLKSIVDIIAPVDVAQQSSPINLARRYIWIMSNTDLDVAMKLWLTGVKKY